MDHEALALSGSVSTLDAPAAPSCTLIAAEEDVSDFVSKNRIRAEYDKIPRQLEEAFSPEFVSASIMPSFEDDSDRETIVFRVKCALDDMAFRSAMERLFGAIFAENPRIFPFIAVIREA